MYSFSADKGKTYIVSKNALCLSTTFKDMIDCTKDRHIKLTNVIQKHETIENVVYHLNTDRLLSYVYNYMKIWEGKEHLAAYVKEEPVQTSELSHVFADSKGNVYVDDINFIENFIRETMANIRDGKLPGYPPINAKLTRYEKRKWIITILGELACQCDELLNIPSLANKIYAYIAVKIWDTSVIDFATAMHDPEFCKAQEKAIEEWRTSNPDKFAAYASAHMTDGINIAPAVDIDDEYSDSE